MEGDEPRGDAHAVQRTDAVLRNCTPETSMVSVTNAARINSVIEKMKLLCIHLFYNFLITVHTF